MKKSIIVGLMYHSFCCGNLGVGALAISECEILKSIAEALGVEIKVLCFEAGINDLYTDTAAINVKLVQTSFSLSMIKRFRECDLIIDVTGGDSFSDIYGMKNFIAIFILKIFSIISGVTVVLAPQTIGPFKNNLSKIAAYIYLGFVKHIFIRDELSKKDIPDRFHNKVTVSSDVAFRLPYIKNSLDKKNKEDALKIGFNISGLLYRGGFNLNNTLNFSYKKMCDNIIGFFLNKGHSVYLVPHVIGRAGGIDNDLYVCEEICKKNTKLKIAPYFNNPIEAKNFISNMDFFIGSRMHATIAAISAEVATVPIAYSRKFRGVFEPLGYDVFLDATQMSTEEIVNKIILYINQIDELKLKSHKASLLAQKRLKKYEEYIYNFLKNKYMHIGECHE